ncbi:putative inorganic phosphate cotransporter, partial [Eupeodes corollae]|uniref:putative inorganic phosphate cotransporter n=1 Tax=Eupeodes corollae TaxID=290404 RepID=UPI0024901B89
MAHSSEHKGPVIGARHLQVFLLFLAIAVSFMERSNVSIAVVAMTDAQTTNSDFHEFNWNEIQKSYILSSFYWGYVVTQFPGGYLVRMLGVKACIFIAVLGSSICNLLVPLCVPWGEWQAYCVIRVIQGLFQGFLFPTAHAHMAIWSPVEERTILGGLAYVGIPVGIILAMSLTGVIAASGLGWPGISYVYGGIGIVFCVVWLIFAENNPTYSRFITSEEREYIITSQDSDGSKHQEKIPIPWKAILTSPPFLSLLAVQICQAWSASIVENKTPAYLHGVLNMDIKSNALFSTLPFIAMLVMSLVFLFGADIVLKRQWASVGVVQKSINTIAMWGSAAVLFGIGFLDENQKTLAITLLILNLGLGGGITIGSMLNTNDLSPNHAGILMGIWNCIASFVLILTPLIVGVIIYDESKRSLWQIVFIIAAFLSFFGNLQYLFFGSTKTQSWNDPDYLIRHDIEKSKSVNNSTTTEL